MKFLVVIETGDANYSPYSPDIPGCIATSKSVEETLANMHSSLEFHLEGMTGTRRTDSHVPDTELLHSDYR